MPTCCSFDPVGSCRIRWRLAWSALLLWWVAATRFWVSDWMGGMGMVISTSSRSSPTIPGVPPSRFTMPAGEAQDMATSGTWLGWSPDGDGSWWGQDTRWEPSGTNDQQGYWRQLRSVEWSYLNHGMIGPQLSWDIK